MTSVTRRLPLLGSCAFFLAGPGLEAGLGPWVVAQAAGGSDSTPALVLRVAGVTLMAAGLAVILDAFTRFVSDGRGTPSPMAPPQRLVITGAYRHMRHPMYVATAAMIAGEGLAFGVPALLACAAVYLATVAGLSRLREEPRLSARFGAEYGEYRRAVPGWWPRLRPWQPSAGRSGPGAQ
jgi:protein-S-isoprenylcysteine O-methyltransferase Ste14